MRTQANCLDDAARRFERWRGSLRGPGRTPNELWQLAAQVAIVRGASETAQRLGLEQARLKRRMQEFGHANVPTTASFVELPPLPLGATAECTFEPESPTAANCASRARLSSSILTFRFFLDFVTQLDQPLHRE